MNEEGDMDAATIRTVCDQDGADIKRDLPSDL